MKPDRSLLLATCLLVSSPALAHTGHSTSDFAAGFLHPFGGIDHVLAMAGVGLFAATLSGRALWAVPAAFVAMMMAGGFLGFAHVQVPGIEIGIAVSVILIGALIALGRSDMATRFAACMCRHGDRRNVCDLSRLCAWKRDAGDLRGGGLHVRIHLRHDPASWHWSDDRVDGFPPPPPFPPGRNSHCRQRLRHPRRVSAGFLPEKI